MSWAAGTLESTVDGRRKKDENSWSLSTTWEALGVPAGTTVKGVKASSLDYQITAVNVFDQGWSGWSSTVLPAATLADGGTTIELAALSGASTGATGVLSTSGTDVSGLSLPSSNSITITIRCELHNANNANASGTMQQDALAFTVTYQ
jgi:UDP-N-acetylglucosamine enolpyruvyl transferase